MKTPERWIAQYCCAESPTLAILDAERIRAIQEDATVELRGGYWMMGDRLFQMDKKANILLNRIKELEEELAIAKQNARPYSGNP